MKPTLSDYEQAGFHAGCAVAHSLKFVIALARTKGWRVAFAGALLVGLFFLTGCNHTTRLAYASPVVSTPVIASQEGKDTAIINEAAQIDSIAPQAKPHTDAQRAAVAAAPAAQVGSLVKAFESQVAELMRDNKAKDKQINALRDAEQKKQVATCRWIGLGALALAVLLAYLKLGEWSLVSGGVGMLSLGLAQLISQPWFTTALNCALAVCAAGLAFAAWRSYRRNTLAADATEQLDRMKGTLTTLIPAVDGALASLDSAAQTLVKNALSRAMDSSHKQLVKEIRAKL